MRPAKWSELKRCSKEYRRNHMKQCKLFKRKSNYLHDLLCISMNENISIDDFFFCFDLCFLGTRVCVPKWVYRSPKWPGYVTDNFPFFINPSILIMWKIWTHHLGIIRALSLPPCKCRGTLRLDHSRRGGRVAFYIRKSLSYNRKTTWFCRTS